MNQDQSITAILQDLSAMKESLKSAHKRIDRTEDLTQQIHRLAVHMETLTAQVKEQSERMGEVFKTLETRMKTQGERIGAIETDRRLVERIEKSITELSDKVEALEKEPGDKWKSLVSQIITIIIAVVAGIIIAHVLGGYYGYYS